VPVADILSIQLYTLRSLNDLDTILDSVAGAGFRKVEGIGSHLDDATNVKAKLDARGLKFSSSHVSLAALRERPDQVIAACRLLGFDQLFMPAVPQEQRDMDASGWRALGRELGTLATRFADGGIRLGYHNHNWELKPKDGANTALELLFAEAEGTPLTWQADVAWLVRGGAAPEEWLQRYRDRLVSAHVKDIAPEGTKLACWIGTRCGRPVAIAVRTGWSSNTTSRPIPHAALARVSPGSRNCKAE
jgi:sugar phosphate isomerase/epimerase